MQEADFKGANLEGTSFDNAQRRFFKIKKREGIPQQEKIEKRREDTLLQDVKNYQDKIEKLEKKLQQTPSPEKQKELEASKKAALAAEKELAAVRKKLAAIENLGNAIQEISKAKNNNEELLTTYRTQSNWLMWFGISCFATAVILAFIRLIWMQPEPEPNAIFWSFSPSFLF